MEDSRMKSHDLSSDSSSGVEIKEIKHIQGRPTESQRLQNARVQNDQDLLQENDNLFTEIVRLCELSDPKKPEVILLVGKTGGGKSAFVNTVHKVITGNYYMIARQGSGKAQTITMGLNRYENCGISVHNIKDVDRRDTIGRILPCLPHIIDCVGLGDENSPAIAEILDLLIGGYIPPSTLIQALQASQEQFGVGSLKLIFTKVIEAWKITKIVFVQSCTDSIPRNLLECLSRVLRAKDHAKMKRKYTAEIFLMITKFDLVRGNNLQLNLSEEHENEEIMSLDTFKTLETDLAYELNLIGTVKSESIRWVSLTDRTKEDNPCVDNKALKFLKKMLEPCPVEKGPDTPYLTFTKYIVLHVYMFANWMRNELQLVFVIAIIVALVGVLFKLLSADI